MAKWKTSAIAETGTGYGKWFRSSHTTFDATNFAARRWLVDAQAAKANYYRGQTASQFGYGNYSLKLNVLPSDGNACRNNNAQNGTRVLRTRMKVRFFPHTYYRKEALAELKRLESWDNTSGSTSVDDAQDLRVRGLDNKPLLLMSASLDDTSPETHDAPVVQKGSQIIRFGFEQNHPAPYRQSTVTVDLNADGDTTDSHETQNYVLVGESANHFGIFNRMEGAVNPVVDLSTNETKIEKDWAYPMNNTKVKGWQERIVECWWTERDGSFSTTITGIEAVGGLIGIEMEYADSGGTGIIDTQNYELQAELSCHGWTAY